MIEWLGNPWVPPVAVMTAGFMGAVVMGRQLEKNAKDSKAIEDEGRREDLKRRQDEALEALAVLEQQKEMMAPEDYQAERQALLDKGAGAMRALEGQSEKPTSKVSMAELDAALAQRGPKKMSTQNKGDAMARGIAELTAALKRGEIDEVTYAKAVAALSDASSAPADPGVSDDDEPPPPAAPAPSKAAPPPAPPKKDPGTSPMVSPLFQGAIYAAAGIAIIAGLVYYASGSSVPRREGASMTGNQDLGTDEAPPAGAPGQQPPWMAKKKADAEARLKANPKDVAALNELTQLALNEPQTAWSYNEQAREVDPDDVDARMLHGVISAIMGMPDIAHEKFEALLAEHPDHAPTWAWKGLTFAEQKNWPEAAKALRKAKELGLNDHTLDNTLQMAENGGVPVGKPPAQPAPAPDGAPSATLVSGVVKVDPSRSTFKAQTVFVNLKDPKRPGPPLAAKKLPAGPYPLAFRLTEADRISMGPMANQPLPDNLVLSVRMDDDGNAFTKSPTDPQVSLEVTRGTKDLELTMK